MRELSAWRRAAARQLPVRANNPSHIIQPEQAVHGVAEIVDVPY
jgi:hypothetical protein